MLAGAEITDEARAAADRLLQAATASCCDRQSGARSCSVESAHARVRWSPSAQATRPTSRARLAKDRTCHSRRNPRRQADRGGGRGRARAAGAGNRGARPSATIRTTRRPSPMPTTTRCASAQRAIEAALSGTRHGGFAVAESRRRAVRALRQGAPCACRCCRSTTPLPTQDVADFVGRVRALPQARQTIEIAFTRRAEDRRALDVAALRGRRARHGRDARRRRRRRGRHRQHPHARGRAAQAEGPQCARRLRGARRGLHDQERISSRSTSGRRPPATPSSPIRAIRRRARCARRIRRSPRRGRSASSPMPGAR